MAGYLSSNVQQVSIVMNGLTSNTATISAVSSRAFTIFQGFQAERNNDARNSNVRITLTNSTTLTATRNNGGTNMTVNAVVFDGSTDLIESVQYGSLNITNPATSGTATISSVDTSRSVVYWLGELGNHDYAPYLTFCALTLTNSTTVTGYTGDVRSGYTTTASFCVVQFKAAVIQSVQHISDAYTSANTTDNKTISSVDTANSIIAWGGCCQTDYLSLSRVAITSATNVQINRNGTGTASRRPCYAVLEFKPGVLAGTPPQTGNIDMQTDSGYSTKTATISSVSTTQGSAVMSGWQTFASVNDNYEIRVALTNSTTVTANRVGDDNGHPYQMVQYQTFEFSSVVANIKTWSGISMSNIKTFDGIAAASVKTLSGITK